MLRSDRLWLLFSVPYTPSCSASLMPNSAFSGVRSSWLIDAKNSSFNRLARASSAFAALRSAVRSATCCASWARSACKAASARSRSSISRRACSYNRAFSMAAAAGPANSVSRRKSASSNGPVALLMDSIAPIVCPFTCRGAHKSVRAVNLLTSSKLGKWRWSALASVISSGWPCSTTQPTIPWPNASRLPRTNSAACPNAAANHKSPCSRSNNTTEVASTSNSRVACAVTMVSVVCKSSDEVTAWLI